MCCSPYRCTMLLLCSMPAKGVMKSSLQKSTELTGYMPLKKHSLAFHANTSRSLDKCPRNAAWQEMLCMQETRLMRFSAA